LALPSPRDEPRVLGREEAPAIPCREKVAGAPAPPESLDRLVKHRERFGFASLQSAQAQLTLVRVQWADHLKEAGMRSIARARASYF
jgi:hypothetical protein